MSIGYDTQPITCWYQQHRGADSKLFFEYNHFEDGHVTQGVPTPRGGTVWKGRWFYKHGERTVELCPKVIVPAGDPILAS